MKLPRYPAYKDSGVKWMGDVPAHWEIATFKRLLDLQNGADHKAIETDDGIPVIGSGGAFAFASKAMFDGESVLLGRKGTIDRPVYVNGPFWTVDTMYWSKVNPGFSAKFAYYAATTIPFGYYSTNTALPSMTKAALNAHAVACPAYDEQSAIAAFLDRETAKIEALIAEQERLLALLSEKRQAIIYKAVSQGLDPTVPRKDSGLPWLKEVPEHWEIKRLKAISPFVSVGIVVNPSAYVSDEGLPYIYGGDISEGYIDTGRCRRISPEASSAQSKTQLRSGDLLTVRVGAPGVTAVVPEDCEGGNCASVMLIRGGDFDSEWLCHAMNSRMVRYQVEVVQYGAAQEQFNIGHAVNFVIPTPPVQEQSDIANHIRSEVGGIDRLSDNCKRAISLLSERRSALISSVVTGRFDVRGVA